MKPSLTQMAVFTGLVAVGVAGRFLFLDIPNFTPTTALALFAGFYFARRLTALAVPLCIMLLSNLWLPSYSTAAEMVIIYAALVLPVLVGEWLQRKRHVVAIAAAGLLPSFVFYVVSNCAVWGLGNMYPHTLAGLTLCYVNAVPFYGWMLAADVLFAALVFGGYALTRVPVRPVAEVVRLRFSAAPELARVRLR